MRKLSNVVLVASIGLSGLIGGGCKTDNTPESNPSGIFGNSRKRDFAIKVLTFSSILNQLNRAAQQACNNADQKPTGSSTPEAGDYDKSEFKKTCFETIHLTLEGPRLFLGPVSVAAKFVTVDAVTRNWWIPIVQKTESPSYEASVALNRKTPGFFESNLMLVAQAYKDNESGEAAGLKVAKEAARLLLPRVEDIRGAVDKAVGDKLIKDNADYASAMKELKEPLSNPKFAGLLPEVRDFYMSQLADIEKSLP